MIDEHILINTWDRQVLEHLDDNVELKRLYHNYQVLFERHQDWITVLKSKMSAIQCMMLDEDLKNEFRIRMDV